MRKSVSCGNSLQPVEGTFRFDNADRIVNFAQSNRMLVYGHTLCWHNQVPDSIFKDGSVTATKALVLERLRTHIKTVMTHYKDKTYGFDVVNEAIDDGLSENHTWLDNFPVAERKNYPLLFDINLIPKQA
ncbi:MAG: endo-1,4-beta-xylanase [Bacteroidales bacterium]|nr:endo-1,4-beta-xylanase [Bacteroidales bacterium]